MALSNLMGWAHLSADSPVSACGSSCRAGSRPAGSCSAGEMANGSCGPSCAAGEKPAASCSAGEKPGSSCASSCGAGDR